MSDYKQDLRKHSDLMKNFVLKEARKIHRKLTEDNGITAKIEVCDKCECNPCECGVVEEELKPGEYEQHELDIVKEIILSISKIPTHVLEHYKVDPKKLSIACNWIEKH